MDKDNAIILAGGTNHRIAIIDYLKALSIIFVIMNHSGLFDTSMPLHFFMIEKAVPIFMILSGHVYALNSDKKSIIELYNYNSIKKKFIRFTVPM